MILTSPHSIALTTNEDVHLSADGQIGHSAGDSINFSTQKNLLAHAQSKISLFAAQDGAKFYAGQGKVEIQAQADGVDLIARKGVQIISTEDAIYITSPKEIKLIADGSELKINSSGVFATTSGKFEVKAGQHKFMSGGEVSPNLPQLPKLEFAQSPYSAQYQLFKADGRNFKGYKYFISDNQNNLMKEGITDEYGFTEQVVTETRERIIGYKSVMRESERLTENWEAKLEEKSKKLESELDGE